MVDALTRRDFLIKVGIGISAGLVLSGCEEDTSKKPIPEEYTEILAKLGSVKTFGIEDITELEKLDVVRRNVARLVEHPMARHLRRDNSFISCLTFRADANAFKGVAIFESGYNKGGLLKAVLFSAPFLTITSFYKHESNIVDSANFAFCVDEIPPSHFDKYSPPITLYNSPVNPITSTLMKRVFADKVIIDQGYSERVVSYYTGLNYKEV